MKKKGLFVIALLYLVIISISCTTRKMKDYYSRKCNYITVTVMHIAYSEDESTIYG